MDEWVFSGRKERLKNAVAIVGLPGIANAGKLAVDFLVEALNAKKIAEFESFAKPNVVFVTEKNLVELPSIVLYHAKRKRDILLVGGDYQPVDEQSCFRFCDKTLSMLSELGCAEIITLGGIALRQSPKKPRLYCTGSGRQAIQRMVSGTGISEKVHGAVGPIIGVSGVLLGLAKKRKVDAVCILAETFGHPTHLGVEASREILEALNKKFKLGITPSQLVEESAEVEAELAKLNEAVQSKKKMPQFRPEASYIG